MCVIPKWGGRGQDTPEMGDRQHPIYVITEMSWYCVSMITDGPVADPSSYTYHGKLYGYSSMKCRCNECRRIAREYAKQYRSTDKGRAATQRSAARNNYIRQQAVNWLREHRPDVVSKIEREWEEKLATD